MINLVPYIFKSVLSFALFYSFFVLLLQKETSYKFNRFYLIGTSIFSIIVPFITLNLTSFGLGREVFVATENVIHSTNVEYVIAESPTIAQSFNWAKFGMQLIIGVYLFGAFIMLFKFIVNLISLISIIWKGEKLRQQKLTLILNPKVNAPHTFFKFIFLNKVRFYNGNIENEVIEHEKAHVIQLHSIDILLIEIIKIIFWFNPFVWLYKKDIQLNHEYLADEAVLELTPVIKYQTVLLKTIQQTNSTNLVSNFNYSSTKKRFIMMTKTKLNKRALMIRLGLLFPLAITIFCFSVNLQAQENKSDEQNEKVIKIVKEDDGSSSEKVIKIKAKADGNGTLSKEEIANIKSEIEREINENKDLTDKEKAEIREEIKNLEKELETLWIEKGEGNNVGERIIIINDDPLDVKKEIQMIIKVAGDSNDGEEKKMIFISDDDEDVQIIRLNDKDENGLVKKVFISEDGKDIRLIEPEGKGQKGKTIVIHTNGDSDIKVLNENENSYKYEWKSKSDEGNDVNIDVNKLIEESNKEIRVIINGESYDLKGLEGLEGFEKNLRIEIEEEVENALNKESKSTIKIIEIESSHDKSSKKDKKNKK